MADVLNNKTKSDAEWYCRHNDEEDRFYDIFFKLCRKYNVNWASATDKERAFIEEITRVTYERDRAVRMGLDLKTIEPAFAS